MSDKNCVQGHWLAPLTPHEDVTVPGLFLPSAVCSLPLLEPSSPACPAFGGSSGCPEHTLPSPGPWWAAWTPKFPIARPVSSVVPLCAPASPPAALAGGCGARRGLQMALLSLNGHDAPHLGRPGDAPHLVLPTHVEPISAALWGGSQPCSLWLRAELALAAPWGNGVRCVNTQTR